MLFHEVQLELVRPGTAHNQPLNKLTQYLALCGESSPITFNVDFEHGQLLSRLEQLRYYVESAGGRMVPVGASIRESELSKLGGEMGALLSKMPSLATELSARRPENWQNEAQSAQIVHLRIVLSGSELAILPFELSIAPDAMPGEGSQLFLQSRMQVVPTREIRRSRPLSTRLSHFDQVKVLFIYAAPGSDVPAVEHLHAIRCALDPWVGQAVNESGTDSETRNEARAAQLKRWIRVLPNATLRSIEALCSKERFSHVHILAHGATYREAGQTRFGIALCSDDNPNIADVVPGQRLAHALTVESQDRNDRSAPFWVTLASCDSANTGSILAPGGSLAHELHTSGIPWVLASQFPLTKKGSTDLTRILYERLFGGDDPRQALYETRKQLFTHAKTNHDWASLVTYASIPPDFDQNVATFFEHVNEAAIERVMANLDQLLAAHDTSGEDEEKREDNVKREFAKVESLLDRWKRRVPQDDSASARRGRTIFYGITGSVNKRLALHTMRGTGSGGPRKARELMIRSQRAYRTAAEAWSFEDNLYNWVASQYLSTSAVLGRKLDPSVRAVFRATTERAMSSDDPEEAAWAKASFAEDELLQLHVEMVEDLHVRTADSILAKVEPLLVEIKDEMGPESFHVESTRRQFERYSDGFSGLASFDYRVAQLAQDFVKTLGG